VNSYRAKHESVQPLAWTAIATSLTFAVRIQGQCPSSAIAQQQLDSQGVELHLDERIRYLVMDKGCRSGQ